MQPTAGSLRCRFGLHDLVDFPDPNPETQGQREAQGYRACTRCPKSKDGNVYSTRKESLSARSWWTA